MTEQTALLNLPYIMPAQAQKHVTHNEALRMLDALVHIRVEARDLDEPPTDPVEGRRWIVGATPSGAFAGHAGDLAVFQDGAWAFYLPRNGWLAWDGADNSLFVFDGTDWTTASIPQNVPLVGVNTTADETNRLAVASDATLLTHDGTGHQLKLNKATISDTGSLLFQTAWSGRAEMGLAGDDDFSIKVSADGEDWHTALAVDRNTGRLRLGDLDAASPSEPSNNRALSVDDDGAVVLTTPGFPAYVMTGVESGTTTLRSYDAQVAKGTGLYVSDNGGEIAANPGNEWSSMAITGIMSSYFAQLVLTSSNGYFRSGTAAAPGDAPWYTLSKQTGLTAGRVPYHDVWGLPHQHNLSDSMLYQGSGHVGIGTETPHASALLDLSSAARGLLPPRMTTTERDAIASPAEGLVIYNLTAHEPQFWNGAAWAGMAS